ncbi:hypothetical protein [Psittacicella hinzii]|nr:hypothetical protein [Psittacicella hinzii]
MKKCVEQAKSMDYKCIMVDSISPGWNGKNGIFGKAFANKSGNLNMRDHMMISRANDDVLSYIANLELPFICTIKQKRTTDGKTFEEVDKTIQKRDFEFHFDLIVKCERVGYTSPKINNGEIFSEEAFKNYCNDLQLTSEKFRKDYNIQEIHNVVNLEKSRLKAWTQGQTIKITKWHYLAIYAEVNDLYLSVDVYDIQNQEQALQALNSEHLTDFDKRAIKYLFDL